MSETNDVVTGGLLNVKYVRASVFQAPESAALLSFRVGGVEIRLSIADARALSIVLPDVLAEHAVALAFAPLKGVA